MPAVSCPACSCTGSVSSAPPRPGAPDRLPTAAAGFTRGSHVAAGGHPIDRRRLEAVFLALAQLPQLIERMLDGRRPSLRRGLDRDERTLEHAHVVLDPRADGLVHVPERQ